jgi:hypothetical protein
MVLIEIKRDGKRVRICGARCHRADPFNGESHCCCGGRLRGVEALGIDPRDVPPEYLDEIRREVALAPDEYVQLRIGA